MIFKKIDEKNRLGECIYIAFKDDLDLIKEYHIKGGNFEECVLDTYEKILETDAQLPLDMYEVNIDVEGVEKTIGYCVVISDLKLLYSFGIYIKYRKAYAKELFQQIKNLMDGSFRCGLWNKNKRAINYLLKNGMEIEKINDEITLLCQLQ